MQEWNNTAYGKKIRRRIAGLSALLAGMLVYMVIISELGGGDHRAMSSLAQTVSRVIFFGGMAFVGYRIYRNKSCSGTGNCSGRRSAGSGMNATNTCTTRAAAW